MNHQQASQYQQFFQHHHDIITGNNFPSTAAANPSMGTNITGAPTPNSTNVGNAFMFGHANLEEFYHHQNTHAMPLAYHQAAAVASDHFLRSQHQSHQRYMLQSASTPAANPYFNVTAPFPSANYPVTVGGMDHLSTIKQHQQHTQQHWINQSPSTAALFPSIFQQQQTITDAYFNMTASQQPSGAMAGGGTGGSPLAGLRALSEQYNYQYAAGRMPKSPSKSTSGSTPSSANSDYQMQQRHGRESVQPPTPNAASSIASPPAANIRGPTTNSPQQLNSFVPPSPIQKSSQTAHSSPLSTTTTHSSGHGGNSFLIGSPATPRGHSVSSTGSVDTHIDPKLSSGNPYNLQDGSIMMGDNNPFSMPTASHIHSSQAYEETLVHPSLASFYAQDPSAALMDPATAALFGGHVVGSDPSLHSAVDDALSVLSRDVTLGDLTDITCTNMMVGQNFWEDLGDAVLDDPLLGSHASGGDLVNGNHISVTGSGSGGLLHSVLEFGTLGGSGRSGENGQTTADELTSYRYQDDLTTKLGGTSRSTMPNDLINAAPNSSAVTACSSQNISGEVAAATPKLREKMKRKAQGENELAEIDRAFARHLSMVAEKDGASTSLIASDALDETHVDVALDSLTANLCVTNRMELNHGKNSECRLQAHSPLQFEQIAPIACSQLELEELRKNVRKLLFPRKQSSDKPAKVIEANKRQSGCGSSWEAGANASSIDTMETTPRPARKSNKVPIYKQKSVSNEKIPEQRRSSGAGVNPDSPYNFTDEEEGPKPDIIKDTDETSMGNDQSVNAASDDEKLKIVDDEVTKKLLQISSLHPELKIGSMVEKNADDLRHVVPKKRQQWQAGSNDTKAPNSTAENRQERYSRRKAMSSASMYVKTEIMTDDFSTAMPSTPATQLNVPKSEIIDTASASDEGLHRTLLPKLIIRIPRKCLEQLPPSAIPPAIGLNDEEHHHHHHHHRKKKREKRKKHDSDDDGSFGEDSGERKRRKRHKHKDSVDSDVCQENGCGGLWEAGANPGQGTNSEISSQTNGIANLVNGGEELLQEKKELGSNGFDWDRLPFKLRKKLQRNPGSSADDLSGTTSNNKIAEFNNATSSTSNIDTNYASQMDAEEQQRILADDNEALTNLRSRFQNGPVFQKGAFVVCKDDIGKADCPIWKVDSQNLLQKFSPTDRQGKIVYVSSSTFAGWCVQNQDLYVPVQVRYLIQSRSECVVELESALEEIFPAVSTEITDERHRISGSGNVVIKSTSSPPATSSDCALLDHPLTDALVAYVNVLLLHALMGNFLQGLRTRHNNCNDKLGRVKEVDLVNAEKCKRLLSCVQWHQAFKESVEWYPHCTVSEDEGFGLQCQACQNAMVCNVLQLFANEGYDFETLEPRPPRTTASGSPLPSQDYHLCSSCATIAVRYHKLFHMRYQLFRKCEDEVELVRDGNPTLAAGAVADLCLKNKRWLSNTINEYLHLWSNVG